MLLLSSVADTVARLRRSPVRGSVIDLVPYAPCFHDALIALRNTDRASYFLHQPAPLTRDGQQRWFEAYLERDDDVQWIIALKDGTPIGGTALYGITPDRARAEKGRLVIDETRSKQGPYVLEAELLLLDIAFEQFGVQRIETCVRDDNGVMQSINARMGFERVGEQDIRGVTYFDYVVSSSDYTSHVPVSLRAIPAAWARRAERIPAIFAHQIAS